MRDLAPALSVAYDFNPVRPGESASADIARRYASEAQHAPVRRAEGTAPAERPDLVPAYHAAERREALGRLLGTARTALSQAADLLVAVREGMARNMAGNDAAIANERLAASAAGALADLVENTRLNGEAVIAPPAGLHPALQAYRASSSGTLPEGVRSVLAAGRMALVGPVGALSVVQNLRAGSETEAADAVRSLVKAQAAIETVLERLDGEIAHLAADPVEPSPLDLSA